VNGLKSGLGKTKWDDGQIYIGTYKAGYMHGKGKLVLPNGTVYEG
jgi:hypothetical protein